MSSGSKKSPGSGKAAQGPFFSSDSDAEVGDELFVVAMARKRTASNEYDGDKE